MPDGMEATTQCAVGRRCMLRVWPLAVRSLPGKTDSPCRGRADST